MSAINLFWQLNISDETKYLLIFFIIICIFAVCFYNKNKNSKNSKNKIKNKSTKKNYSNDYNDDYYNQYTKKKNLTKCHKNYMSCVENNMRNNTDNFCFPCLNDGVKQDFFYDPISKEWISNNYD
jgi:preprotein translocase subunit SecG